MSEPTEKPDRDEIEKLAERLYIKLNPHANWTKLLDKDKERDVAEFVLANFVPRPEHEELKERYEKLLARYAEMT